MRMDEINSLKHSTPSRSNSRNSSSNSEIDKEINDLNISGITRVSGNGSGNKRDGGSIGSLTGGGDHSTASSNGSSQNKSISKLDNTSATGNGGTAITTVSSTTTTSSTTTAATTTTTKKHRISSSRTPTVKARRVRFYRNGDRFYAGIVIAVSNERYRSFESLAEDLTRLLEDKISGAVRNIYTTNGKKITSLDEIEDGKNYVCLCNNETYKKIDYSPQPLKIFRPSSPLKINTNGIGGGGGGVVGGGSGGNISGNGGDGRYTNGTNGCGGSINLTERDTVVHPKIVTLIRNGTKPRKILRLLLNKRNSPSYDHVLTAITQCVKLHTGCVRKVYTLSGVPVLSLADFFGSEDVFFAYGTERLGGDDFKLEPDETKAVNQTRKTLRNSCVRNGSIPKMPIKNSVNLHNVTYENVEEIFDYCDIDLQDLPEKIQTNYALGPEIGDGNFAVVLKVKSKQTGKDFALKIIDKSKCKGKEHYIDAEVRVMKKLQHPHIMSLIMNVDTPTNMFLVLEYVSGGDLFDAITTVTRFVESEACVMIRHLASAMAYLHSLGIVHRDIKPENLLVELDSNGCVTELKLADFGLACEVLEPLYAVCGTPTYVAPEILMETGYGLKIDVWAAGIILYILLCGFPPFVSQDNQQEQLFDAILSGTYEFPEPYWNDIGESVRDLISNMLQSDPDLRFSSEDVLDHPWTINSEFVATKEACQQNGGSGNEIRGNIQNTF